MNVFIVGAGKVGRALATGLKRAGDKVTLRAARAGLPTRKIHADVIVLAVRERELGALATALAASGFVQKKTVVVHNSGSLDSEVLAPLRSVCAGVAQMHPMISFASLSAFPELTHGHCHVQGDAPAEKRARELARHLGMTPRTFANLDTAVYHASAALVANGAAALAALGAELLVAAGVSRPEAPKMLGPLLRSVADNVTALGFPGALTGPVRRGDAAAIKRQLAKLEAVLPRAIPLFVASAWAQLPLARALGEAPPEAFDELAALLVSTQVVLTPASEAASTP